MVIIGCDRTKGHFIPALILARYIHKHKLSKRISFYPIKREWRSTLIAEGIGYNGLFLDNIRGIAGVIVRLIESVFLTAYFTVVLL